jgi:hypothetical protein
VKRPSDPTTDAMRPRGWVGRDSIKLDVTNAVFRAWRLVKSVSRVLQQPTAVVVASVHMAVKPFARWSHARLHAA